MYRELGRQAVGGAEEVIGGELGCRAKVQSRFLEAMSSVLIRN